jgi:hypothetical protein
MRADRNQQFRRGNQHSLTGYRFLEFYIEPSFQSFAAYIIHITCKKNYHFILAIARDKLREEEENRRDPEKASNGGLPLTVVERRRAWHQRTVPTG